MDVIARDKDRGIAHAVALKLNSSRMRKQKPFKVLVIVDSAGTPQVPGNDRAALELDGEKIAQFSTPPPLQPS